MKKNDTQKVCLPTFEQGRSGPAVAQRAAWFLSGWRRALKNEPVPSLGISGTKRERKIAFRLTEQIARREIHKAMGWA